MIHVHDGAGTLASSTVATNVVGPVREIRRGSSPSNATIALPPSMCTTIFPSRGVASPHRRAAIGGGARAGATRLRDAGAALVDPHRDGVGGRAGLDDLEVDVRQPGAEGGEIDGRDVVDGHDGVRVPDAEVGDGPVRIGAEVAPAVGGGEIGDLAHLDRHHERAGVVGRSQFHTTRAGVGGDALRAEVAAASGERLGEAADAVAAHLGAAAVGVVQHHAGRVLGVGLADEQAVGADAGVPVADHLGEVRQLRLGQRRVEDDEEVVAETVVLAERDARHRCRTLTTVQRSRRRGRGRAGRLQWGRCRSSVCGGHDGTTAPGARRTAACAARSRPRPPRATPHRRGARAVPCSRAPAPRSATARRAPAGRPRRAVPPASSPSPAPRCGRRGRGAASARRAAPRRWGERRRHRDRTS